jgi:glycerate dehydrogenase
MMRIVVLDGYTMNPGDMDWQPLMQLGECMVYDRTPADRVIQRSRDADVVITNKVVFDKQLISQLPTLKYIGVSATGFNVVDVAAAREAGILVTNVPAYSTMSVVQMVFAHILNLTMPVAPHAESVRNGKWTNCQDFAFWDFPLIELDGLTLGIIGLGRIGRAVATTAHSFGMKVFFTMPRKVEDAPEWATQVDLEPLLSHSDIVTLHCPLTDETHHLINSERLALMKKSAFLINTGRGPLLDEAAVAHALNSGHIAGAGLDVLSSEPPLPENPLLAAQNCHITPHHAWATGAARRRLLDVVVANVRAFQQGQPINVVN